MSYHMQHRHRATLMAKADPDCDECAGFGVVTVDVLDDPETAYDQPCGCVERNKKDHDFTRGVNWGSSHADLPRRKFEVIR